jgi:CO/xanthine dehydrogenase Mo-binding subunit
MIEKIEAMAAALMTVDQIAALTDIDPDELRERIALRSDPVSMAYRRGKAQTIFDIKAKVIKLAKAGSPQAELLSDRYMNEQQTSER